MIKPKEQKIKELLKTNVKAQQAFNKMLNYYEVMDKLYMTTHAKLIKSIYVKSNYNYAWQLANIANVGNSTCCLYRNNYVKCFYLCFED